MIPGTADTVVQSASVRSGYRAAARASWALTAGKEKPYLVICHQPDRGVSSWVGSRSVTQTMRRAPAAWSRSTMWSIIRSNRGGSQYG